MAADVQHYGPFDIQSGKVTSTSDSGATADRSQWYTAPDDRFFVDESIKITLISARPQHVVWCCRNAAKDDYPTQQWCGGHSQRYRCVPRPGARGNWERRI
jgi:hypothetical protein